MRYSYLLITTILLINSCHGQSCKEFSPNFKSYTEAIAAIKSTHFKVSEHINAPQSSWIRKASFFSCDGKIGFFIFSTHKKEYVHKDVPIEIWKGFIKAPSPGKYYNQYIRMKFGLVVDEVK